MTLVTPSLPSIQATFGLEGSHIAMSQAIYLLGLALPQLAFGAFSDRIGRRGPLLAGILLFIAGSILSAAAQDIAALSIGRLLQAIGASSGMVIGRALLRDMYPEAKMAGVLGYLTMATMVLPIVAPSVGAILQEAAGWRANFWLTGILGVLLVMGILLTVPRDPNVRRERNDAGVVWALLRSPRFLGMSTQVALTSSSNQAFFVAAPFLLERSFALTPAQYGMWFAVPSLAFLVGNFVSARTSSRFGIDRMVFVGAMASGAIGLTFLLVQYGLGMTPVWLFVLIGVLGFFHGLIVPNALAGATSSEGRGFGMAAGLAGCIQMVASAAFVIIAMPSVADAEVTLIWTIAGVSIASVLLYVPALLRLRR